MDNRYLCTYEQSNIETRNTKVFRKQSSRSMRVYAHSAMRIYALRTNDYEISMWTAIATSLTLFVSWQISTYLAMPVSIPLISLNLDMLIVRESLRCITRAMRCAIDSENCDWDKRSQKRNQMLIKRGRSKYTSCTRAATLQRWLRRCTCGCVFFRVTRYNRNLYQVYPSKEAVTLLCPYFQTLLSDIICRSRGERYGRRGLGQRTAHQCSARK